MAMTMEGEERIEAPLEAVWLALNDVDVLRDCIPGCERLSASSPTEMTATVVLKIGPIKAKFAGEVRLLDLRPPYSYSLVGEGKGGIAGFARGGADVTLIEVEPRVTTLRYAVKADVGGKIAQLGSRLVDTTARKLAGAFFGKLKDAVTTK
jgi:carbon monoxide dehydrogenase subunit G